jgi:PAS domain S-box-containing protein
LTALDPSPAPATSTLLLVEDDSAHAELAARALTRATPPPEIVHVETLRRARGWLTERSADLIISDLRLPDGSPLELLEGHDRAPQPVVVMTSHGDEAWAVAALKAGALDYVVKSPSMYRELPLIVERALCSWRNLRERHHAERSLRESEDRFQQLASSIQDAFWLYDLTDDRLVYVSPAWERMFGVTADEALRDASARLRAVHPEDRGRVSELLSGAHLRSALAVSPLRFEYRCVTAGRALRWVEERAFPVHGNAGLPWRVAGLATDITTRRELEGALNQASKMDAIGQLAGGIAHDFNNMLGAILGAAEELNELVQDQEPHRELCQMIVSASEKASQLTGKLLAFSRKSGKVLAPVDLNEVVKDTVTLLSRSVDRRVRISVTGMAAGAPVMGDAAQLQNALLNLGINARDAMPDGGTITLSTELRELDADACSTIPFSLSPGTYVRVAVRDTGAGIPRDVLPRVFEPFFTTKAAGRGTGLGLPAVYGTAVEHHGAVTVYSEEGRGTVFYLYIPVSANTVELLAEEARVPRGSGLVLLVDDEPLMLLAATRQLIGLGYSVVTAVDGEDGVSRFRSHHHELIAVICDVVMPLLSGVDAALRMHDIDASVPLILSSGFPGDERPGELVDRGIADFISKPFNRGTLARLLARSAHVRSVRSGLERQPAE